MKLKHLRYRLLSHITFWKNTPPPPAPIQPLKNIQHTPTGVIAVQLKGGIGDQLLDLNWLYHLKNYLNGIDIDLYCRTIIKDVFCKDLCFLNSCYFEMDDIAVEKYDLILKVERFPKIIYENESACDLNIHLKNYVEALKKFEQTFSKFFSFGNRFDGVSATYSTIVNKKRIQQPDVFGLLNVGRDFPFEFQIPKSALADKFNLYDAPFITFHRGCDTNHTKNSNKLWPLQYYNALINAIKKKFPHLILVQLGINSERCPDMEKIDVNLVGQTTMADICDILKHSALHIDGEGGFVHIRHALKGGKSVVLFGPTSPEFFGYDENINLRSTVCPCCCEHILEKWDEKCLITNTDKPLCMKELKPETVISTILKELENV